MLGSPEWYKAEFGAFAMNGAALGGYVMSAIDAKFRSAHKHLEALEGWEIDHSAAMECYDLEDWLAVGVSVYDVVLVPLDQFVRREIYRSSISPLPDVQALCRDLYAHWLRIADSAVPLLAKCQADFGSVKHADEFRSRIESARHALANWTAPVRALAPAMQGWEVTAEEAEQLDALVKAKPGEAGTLTREPRPMAAGDPSLIR